MTKIITSNLPGVSNFSEPTTNYFNTLTDVSKSTSSNVNDMLVSFFQEWTGSLKSGELLAGSILAIADSHNISPAEILDQFVKLDKKDVNSYITLLLNMNRIGTSLLGISNIPHTNTYIQRTILP